MICTRAELYELSDNRKPLLTGRLTLHNSVDLPSNSIDRKQYQTTF